MRSGGVVDWESIKEFLSKSILEHQGKENKVYSDEPINYVGKYARDTQAMRDEGKGFNINLNPLLTAGRGNLGHPQSIISGNKAKVEEAPVVQTVARPAPAAKTEAPKAKEALGRANESVFGAGNVLVSVQQLLQAGVPERDIAEALSSIKRGGGAEGLEGQSLKDYYKSLF